MFEILFGHLNWGRISHFAIRNPILHSNWGRIYNFDMKNPILPSNSGRKTDFDIRDTLLTFEFRTNISYMYLHVHSKSYFDIYIRAESHI